MTALVSIIAEIPLASGRGKRAVTVDEAGKVHLFTTLDEFGPEEKPRHSFTADEAVRVATEVLAGRERTATASWSLHVLAAAVLALSAAEILEEAGR